MECWKILFLLFWGFIYKVEPREVATVQPLPRHRHTQTK